jgi:hypothetical protein
MSSQFSPPVIRRLVTIIEEIRMLAGIVAERPLRRAAVAAVLSNPYAGRHEKDLGPLIAWSAGLGKDLGQLAVQALGVPAESYGKGGIAGVNGEQEHANALLTTTMAEGLRDAVGGGKAWISSATKVGPPGTAIDIPLAHKDALYVRSHYDAMEVRIPDAPLPDELVAIVVVASGPRLNARVGGLRAEEIEGKDGLR